MFFLSFMDAKKDDENVIFLNLSRNDMDNQFGNVELFQANLEGNLDSIYNIKYHLNIFVS